MTSLCDWLSLNVMKTNFVLFAPQNVSTNDIISLKLGDHIIERVSHAKVIGIIIDDIIILIILQRKLLVTPMQ